MGVTLGTPLSRPGMGYPPCQDLGLGTPSRPRMGYPPDLGWGTPPPLDLGWGTPQPELGYPPQPEMGYLPRPEMGYPPDLGQGTPYPDLRWVPPPQVWTDTQTRVKTLSSLVLRTRAGKSNTGLHWTRFSNSAKTLTLTVRVNEPLAAVVSQCDRSSRSHTR